MGVRWHRGHNLVWHRDSDINKCALLVHYWIQRRFRLDNGRVQPGCFDNPVPKRDVRPGCGVHRLLRNSFNGIHPDEHDMGECERVRPRNVVHDALHMRDGMQRLISAGRGSWKLYLRLELRLEYLYSQLFNK